MTGFSAGTYLFSSKNAKYYYMISYDSGIDLIVSNKCKILGHLEKSQFIISSPKAYYPKDKSAIEI